MPTKAPKKTAPAKRPGSKKTKARSRYAQVGDDARRKAQRELLLATLEEQSWNLTHTAAALGMSGTPAVIKALQDVAPEEYERAKQSKKISPGNRPNPVRP